MNHTGKILDHMKANSSPQIRFNTHQQSRSSCSSSDFFNKVIIENVELQT